MRFNCGPTLEERFEAWQKRRRKWRPWFAWRPVRVWEMDAEGDPTGESSECVWLETIERRSHGYVRYRLPLNGSGKQP